MLSEPIQTGSTSPLSARIAPPRRSPIALGLEVDGEEYVLE
ncbi:hypothetical protein [Natrinema zhouii]|nr:hypothetical protein [Natrinema zhouii]